MWVKMPTFKIDVQLRWVYCSAIVRICMMDRAKGHLLRWVYYAMGVLQYCSTYMYDG